ncbi:SDR family oxidoreductase [Streptomyces sp. NBC_01020]|uniref:SDR family NAD(P)-dependent oxidoreductase n=1 Tax=unclassified Streptomyces TaxID=2593676 RepID=UPI0022554CE4|nr:SDR family NAD(P)-dependent oxidoreductase [Streptomyces sp. NBC_01306]MCX4728817.1 SDR family oxidoreductase [Streptomyces sp. NBC_01306]WSV08373.1 SDR family oxidoreductase [Streptomyces sp. NBC_01020]WSX46459.1 SDR family oxidoreductase [Streptomyces sp. NBC_00963]WSX65473.1 SDR family oxidoreductase [Streptomyces sp. NBC_00932]
MASPVDYAHEFQGKAALITGGASGIGLATARRLVAGGAAVALADFDEEGGRKAAAELTARGARSLAIPMDVGDPESVRVGVEEAADCLGGLHLVVNSAGITGRRELLGEYALDTWHSVIATNLDGVFHSMRYTLPVILDSGGGAVVNVSSILGINGRIASSAYTAAKHGVIGLTKTAALEYATQGVRFNAVGPGFIETPMMTRAGEAARDHAAGLAPVQRVGTADEVAELIVFLLSDRASFINGSYHLVDGAYSAR